MVPGDLLLAKSEEARGVVVEDGSLLLVGEEISALDG
jgi:hypothetical protein